MPDLSILNDPTFTENFWGWIERFAGLAQVCSVPIAVAVLLIANRQLRAVRDDQRRIADELARRPDLKVMAEEGFKDGIWILRRNPNNSTVGDGRFKLGVVNHGSRTADDVTVWLRLANAESGRSVEHFGVSNMRNLALNPGEVSFTIDHFYPEDPQGYYFTVQLPYTERSYHLQVIFSSDRGRERHLLEARTVLSDDA